MRAKLLFPVISVLCAVVSTAAAQTPPTPPAAGTTPPARAVPFVEPKLAFDREVFAYPGEARRDPFKPLGGDDALGPLFEDLILRSIVWSAIPQQSVALVNDGAKKLYKLRVGETVGNARVVGIEKDRVRFAVTNFGMTRQEIMNKAPRKTVTELRAMEGQQSGGQEADVGRLLQQELLKVLQSKQDSNPPVRRDTTLAGIPRNQER